MKVVLTGEGADEILAGYNIFKEDKIRRAWQSGSIRRSALLRRLYPYVGEAGSRDNPMWEKFFGRRLGEIDHPFYSHLIRWENSAWTLRFLSPELRSAINVEELEEQTERELPPGWREWSPLARAEAIEIQTFMSTYLLSCQGDRVAMAHGVEVRYPFLDPNVVEHCFGLPDKFKLRGLRDKRMLRQMASGLLPRSIFDRPKKPYRAPMTAPFFEGKGSDYVDELLSDSGLERYGLIASAPASRLVAKARAHNGRLGSEREEMAVVGVLSLQLLGYHYLQEFPQRLKAAGERAEGLRFQVCEDRIAAVRQ
jgi:asparagine synthase (glutamine-hydrolysing)